MRRLLRHPITWAVLSVGAVALVVALWAFQPWRLWTRSSVDEALPPGALPAAETSSTATAPVPSTPGPSSSHPSATSTAAPVAPAAPPGCTAAALSEGAFVAQEHATSGTARVLRLTDCSRVLRLEGFSTSDGPDVYVWLSAATAGGDWHSYDDGRYLGLGKLKATDGNQNYPIPADAELSGLNSVVIWCDRFNVAFGSAPLG